MLGLSTVGVFGLKSRASFDIFDDDLSGLIGRRGSF